MSRRLSLGTLAASMLTMILVAPAAGAALVERTSTTLLDDCTIDEHRDPETGELLHFFEFCVDGTLEFHTVTTPSGVTIESGLVSTSLAVRFNGEILLNTESQTNRFRNVFRGGVEQVSRLSFTSSFTDHTTGATGSCFVEFHIANGELRWGSQDVVCEGDDPGNGGGEG